jgi:phosphate-selective porin OprO/OprP
VVVRWNNGLSLESADGDNKLQLGTLIQADGRFAPGSPAVIDTFLIRRGRFIFQGRVQKYFEFTFVPDFAGNTLTLFDSYIDTRLSSAFRVRIGKSKSPIGLEQLYSDAALPFAERALSTNLTPNRDVGVDAIADLLKGRVNVDGGVRNGVPDAASGDADTNNGKDFVGRATVHFGAFGVAVGASNGNEVGALPTYRSTALQAFFTYATTAVARGTHSRVSPSAFYYRGPFGAFAEYSRSAQVVATSTVSSDIVNSGWQVTGIIVTTGEKASERGVTPSKPFDPAQRHWGAFQMAVRASELTVDPRAFDLGLAASTSSRTARAFGVGAVWYTTGYIKQMLTYERTVFDGDPNGKRKAENAIIFRMQLSLAPGL